MANICRILVRVGTLCPGAVVRVVVWLLLRGLRMAFSVPSFPLLANISQPDSLGDLRAPTPPFREVDVPCNLAWGRRVNTMSTGGTGFSGVPVNCIDLLLPKLTDVRGPQDSVGPDLAEVPAGSGRWYQVTCVDDVAKGFTNEYRIAVLFALVGQWTAPYP